MDELFLQNFAKLFKQETPSIILVSLCTFQLNLLVFVTIFGLVCRFK